MTQTTKNFELKVNAEIEKELKSVNAEKLAEKAKSSAKQKLWNWDNAIKDFCTENEIKDAKTDEQKSSLMQSVRNKLRKKQSVKAFAFLTSAITKQIICKKLLQNSKSLMTDI